jgi:hypothetical protein
LELLYAGFCVSMFSVLSGIFHGHASLFI